MVCGKLRSLLLAVAMGLAAMLISIGLLEMSPALAREGAGSEPVRLERLAQPPPSDDSKLLFIAFFTDDLAIQITDLSGNNPIGEGAHGGEVRCNRNNCSQKTAIDFTIVFYGPGSIRHRV